jgi:hypothetical protein
MIMGVAFPPSHERRQFGNTRKRQIPSGMPWIPVLGEDLERGAVRRGEALRAAVGFPGDSTYEKPVGG